MGECDFIRGNRPEKKKSWTLSAKMKDLSTLEGTADNPVAAMFSENNYIRASSEILYGFL